MGRKSERKAAFGYVRCQRMAAVHRESSAGLLANVTRLGLNLPQLASCRAQSHIYPEIGIHHGEISPRRRCHRSSNPSAGVTVMPWRRIEASTTPPTSAHS